MSFKFNNDNSITLEVLSGQGKTFHEVSADVFGVAVDNVYIDWEVIDELRKRNIIDILVGQDLFGKHDPLLNDLQNLSPALHCSLGAFNAPFTRKIYIDRYVLGDPNPAKDIFTVLEGGTYLVWTDTPNTYDCPFTVIIRDADTNKALATLDCKTKPKEIV